MTARASSQLFILAGYCALVHGEAPIGIFEGHGDVGAVLHAGSAEYDAATRSYSLSGSGENMWSTADEFHYVWKKVSGDATLTANIAFTTEGGDPHKKAMLVIRQSLNAGSAYADAALDGDGLTSLQWRETTGAATHEIQSNISAPKRVTIEKRGEYFYLSVSADAADSRFSGAGMRVPLTDPFYIGIGVCAHHKESLESAVFSNVALNKPGLSVFSPSGLYRTLETITVESTDRRVAYTAAEDIESPTWTPDGKSLLFTTDGALRRISIDGGGPVAAAASSRLPPDSKNGVPDVVTEDGLSNMFPLLSPDGIRLAFQSYPRAREYPVSNREVMLRVMLLSDKSVRTLAKFYAGGSSFNLPSWSPDSKKLAFVSYQFH